MLGAALFRLTGENRWHELFKNSVDKSVPYIDEVIYVLSEDQNTDQSLRLELQERITNGANRVCARAPQTIYETARGGWPDGITYDLVWSDEMQTLACANMVAYNTKYVKAMANAYLFALGANPKN